VINHGYALPRESLTKAVPNSRILYETLRPTYTWISCSTRDLEVTSATVMIELRRVGVVGAVFFSGQEADSL